MTDRDLDYYLSLNYTYQVRWDSDSNAFGATVVELPGCVATGDNPTEALEALEEAKQAYLEVALAEGWEIPEPSEAESFSGRVLVRMARTLHMSLVKWAEQEGTSLNQLIASALAHALGARLSRPALSAEPPPPAELALELDREVIAARRAIESGEECENALAPLRGKLLDSFPRLGLARPLLSLVDLVCQADRLAETQTRQKEQPFLYKRFPKTAGGIGTAMVQEGSASYEVEDDLQTGQTADT